MRYWLIFIPLIWHLNALPAAAQQARPGAPVAHAPLLDWVSAQVNAAQTVAGLRVQETSVRTLESPFGARTFETESFLSGDASQDRWHRRVLRHRVNGRERPLPTPPRAEMDGWRDGRDGPPRPGPPEEQFAHTMMVPFRVLAHLRPFASVDAVLDDGAYRYDVVPAADEQTPVRKVSLWLDPAEQRLLRTRVVVDPPRPGVELEIETSYARVAGLDLPQQRRVNGVVQMRRRMRTFTSAFSMETRYSDYEVDLRLR